MRVIAGKAKRLNLKTIEGLDTRPITDRIKETLFNMINVQALSRGAKSAVFVENNKSAVNCIKENLRTTKLGEDAVVLALDVMSAIRTLEIQGRVFDIIFMDPPYNRLLEKQVLEALQFSNIIYYNTIIIVEASLDTELDFLENTKFKIYKEKKYKNNKHVFIELK